MDKDFGLNLNDKKLGQGIKLIVIVLLIVVEFIVCAQYVNLYLIKGSAIELAMV